MAHTLQYEELNSLSNMLFGNNKNRIPMIYMCIVKYFNIVHCLNNRVLLSKALSCDRLPKEI